VERPTEMPGGLSWLYDRIEALGFNSLSEFAKHADLHKGNLYRYFSHETKPSIAVLPTLTTALQTPVHTVLEVLGVKLESNFSEITKESALLK
jgi:DNA-binding phage protein